MHLALSADHTLPDVFLARVRQSPGRRPIASSSPVAGWISPGRRRRAVGVEAALAREGSAAGERVGLCARNRLRMLFDRAALGLGLVVVRCSTTTGRTTWPIA